MGAAILKYDNSKRAAIRISTTRAKLLASAASLFSERGYEGAAIREIATAAHLSFGALYSNFTGKDDLYEAAMGRAPPDLKTWLAQVSTLGKWSMNVRAGEMLAEVAEQARQLRIDLYGAEP